MNNRITSKENEENLKTLSQIIEDGSWSLDFGLPTSDFQLI